MTIYVPGTEERDPKKVIMSLQQLAPAVVTAQTDITAAEADIAALESDVAALETADTTFVVGPASATDNGFAVYNGTTGKLVKNHAATVSLTTEVSGTLPVANGGTNYTGGAWTTYTPTPTAASGTFTTVSASGAYLAIGKLVHFCLTITITDAGTAAGAITVALPTGTTARRSAVAVAETAVVGTMGVGRIPPSATDMQIVRYDAATLIGTGHVLSMGGIYEIT